ncbi:uncharacterized protein LOC123309664 [Coccinella septempunctata]|uniref:uncharacterized protein LOC123309664 n=1 Tax=Coccinella septempunctata TaxID=41139 RepID=UPI001D06256C|nr:uncharacterized protein LOC123309664 [Coccinella septempunctata]
MHSLTVFLTIGLLYKTEGLDVKLSFCRFQCHDTCQASVEKSNPNGVVTPPGDYYWRDFYGVIPPDAYPLGPSTQFPQTYIGFVYDPSHNGTFATTIYDGLDYVYNANNGNTTKISKHMQILCTKSPEKMQWFNITKESYKTLTGQGYTVVKAGLHRNTLGKVNFHFIVKTDNCHVTYAGVVNSFSAKLEFALIDGTYQTSDTFQWLMYKKGNDSSDHKSKKSETTSKSFFSHHYEYQIRPDSIIPKFYKKISIGSCSLTCTNEDNAKNDKIKKNVKLLSSMAYFWQPDGLVNKNLSLPSGLDYNDRVSYIGQATLFSLNVFDVGTSDSKETTINYGNSNIAGNSVFQVLGSNFQDKFQWVNTTTADFPKIDKDKLIPGGMFSNGTDTYVCRNIDDRYGTYYPGSARVVQSGTYCHSFFGPEDKFQVLVFNQEKK